MTGSSPPLGVPASLGYRMPAEWEPHAATWLAWPWSTADWPGKGGAIPWVFAELTRWLQRGEVVHLLVPHTDAEARVAGLLRKAGASLDEVDFVHAAVNRTWVRDSLPTFVTTRRASDPHPAPSGEAPALAAIKWRFNGWNRYTNHRKDEAVGHLAARWLGVPTYQPTVENAGEQRRVVLEGGAIDVDGEGTLLATRACLLTGPFARNPHLGAAGTERVFAEQLGVARVIWLDEGIAGDDTSGHVDDFVRFVGPGRVLLAQEPRAADVNHLLLCRAAEVLGSARDAAGRRLEVIPLPMPAPIRFGHERLPASYANFYIGNAVVVVPTFNDPQDRVALGILAELFPDRTVVGIHAVDLVLGLGTLHCSTQQEPVGVPRRRRR
ncbi:MAG: agmatine deiminase family protein [Polyangiaceae bacterium]|nr:agmatine deiminase family protein [Polyangiaceae bacterium]